MNSKKSKTPKQDEIVVTDDKPITDGKSDKTDTPTLAESSAALIDLKTANKNMNDPIYEAQLASKSIVKDITKNITNTVVVDKPASNIKQDDVFAMAERLQLMARSLVDNQLSPVVTTALMKQSIQILNSLPYEQAEVYTPQIIINNSVAVANSMRIIDTNAIPTATRWHSLFSVVHYDVEPFQTLNLLAAPLPNYSAMQHYYPQNCTATAVILNQSLDDKGDNTYINGSQFESVNLIDGLLGPKLKSEGIMEGDPTLIDVLSSIITRFFKHYNQAMAIVLKTSNPINIEIDNKYAAYKADPNVTTFDAYEDFMPQPPAAYIAWRTSHLRPALDAFFTAQAVAGVPNSRFLLPHRVGLDNWRYDNTAYAQKLTHSVDAMTSFVNRLSFDYYDALRVAVNDVTQVANLFAQNRKRYIPSPDINFNVLYHQGGKRALDIMTMRTVEFLNDEMVAMQSMLNDAKIADSQDQLTFASFRRAITTIGKTGRTMKQGSDPTDSFRAMIDQNPSLDDLIKLVVTQQYYLLKRIRLELTDHIELSGEGFTDAFNNLVLLHLFPQAFSPSSFSGVYAQWLRLFKLNIRYHGRFSNESATVPEPNVDMNSPDTFALDLLNVPANNIRAALVRCFDALNFNDPVTPYDPALTNRLIGTRRNPFYNVLNVMPTALYQAGHGKDSSCWGREFRVLIQRVIDFINLIQFDQNQSKTQFVKLLGTLDSIASETNEAVAGVIGNYNLMTTVHSTHFAPHKTFFNGRAEWLAESQPNHYKIIANESGNSYTSFARISPDGVKVANQAINPVAVNMMVAAQEEVALPPNVLTMLFNMCLTSEFFLIMDPLLHLQKVITKTHRMRVLYLTNSIVLDVFSGNQGRTLNYIAFTAGTQLKKSNFNKVITRMLNEIDQSYPTNLTSLPAGGLNETAHITFDLSNIQLTAAGVQVQLWQYDDYVHSAIRSLIRLMPDFTLPFQHMTNLLLFGQVDTDGPLNWTSVAHTPIRVLRFAQFTAQVAAPIQIAGIRPDIMSKYQVEVSDETFTIESTADLTHHVDGQSPYALGRAWTYTPFSNLAAVGDAFYIEANDLWLWEPALRMKLADLLELSRIKLYVGGLFRYVYSNMDNYKSFHDLKIREWFETPSLFSEFPAAYKTPREGLVAHSLVRHVQPVVDENDGIVWKNPDLQIDLSNSGVIPYLEWFSERSPSDAFFNNYKTRPLNRDNVITNMFRNREYQRLYSNVRFLMSGEKNGKPYGVMVNRFTSLPHAS